MIVRKDFFDLYLVDTILVKTILLINSKLSSVRNWSTSKLMACVFIAIIFPISNLFSQRPIDSPIEAARQPAESHLGFFIGFGQNFSSGSIFNIDDYCDCEFEDAIGLDIILGGVLEREITESLYFGISLAYNYRSANSNYKEVSLEKFSAEITQPDGSIINLNDSAIVNFQQSADIDMHIISAMPFIKLDLANILFVRFGFSIGIPIATNFLHKQEVLDGRIKMLGSGLEGPISLAGDGIISEDKISNIISPIMSLEPALGFNFNLEENLKLSPIFQFSIPISNITENGSDFKFSTWRLVLEFRMKI